MKRVTEVYEKILELEAATDAEHGTLGLSTIEIADAVGLCRTNVSRLLNDLVHEGTLLKTKGRPVGYVTHSLVANLGLENRVDGSFIDAAILVGKSQSAFDKLIGSGDSLRGCIDTAKAAVAYPPNGLHTMIFGESGVGKTLFAHCMHDYYQRHFRKSVPFVHFNCADFHQNPQLLLSHLFGHTKGAYSGANSDREGLVHKANGGVLFLDEIHRLPPDGQEMLFSLIDKHNYCKLGSDIPIACKVLLVAATTESPEKSLLKTFMRRIPITLTLPSLRDKADTELFELILNLFEQQIHESIRKDLLISGRVITKLVKYRPDGAVGRLTSDIKQILASSLLASPENEKQLVINDKFLPTHLRAVSSSKPELFDVAILSECGQVYLKDSKAEYLLTQYIQSHDRTDAVLFSHYYSYIKNKLSACFYNQNILSKLIPSATWALTDWLLEHYFNRQVVGITERNLVALHLHIYSQVEAFSCHNIRDNEQLPQALRSSLDALFNAKLNEEKGAVGVMVICHGDGVAQNIAHVCNTLFETSDMRWFDIPLDSSFRDHLDEIEKQVLAIDRGAGVVILTDMGTTDVIAETIQRSTGIDTFTLSSISTPVALEVLRQTYLEGKTLHEIRSYFDKQIDAREKVKCDAILSICTTGQGSSDFIAQKLKELAVSANRNDIKIITLSLSDIRHGSKKLDALQENNNILFAVGTIRPGIDVPFYSISELFSSDGDARFITIIGAKDKETNIYDECLHILSDYIMYLNPKYVVKYIQAYIESNAHLSRLHDDIKLKLVLHIAGMIERLSHQGQGSAIVVDAGDYDLSVVSDGIAIIEEAYGIDVSPQELSYISQISQSD
ncbi:hypothetical protein BIY22_08525 [Vibrio panuliri]|uniref:Transcriptional regulator n=1 Tax=Vibrio panuliri TaxID=1381081 RepID=A0A1Q9HES0_9VIBR|nr:sigma 54-interacting transcriptional regulator [Vibrio panuliri]OLQ88201.1 hypothetical protein BIY22_08525 [Vibrio panuliri]